MQIKAVIIDDEQNNIDNLFELLRKFCADVTLVGTAQRADEGKKIIREHEPDLVFLDIQMPGETGLDLLRSFDRYHFDVIFVTAYDHYAIPALRLSAIDYLVKPINVEELKSAVLKVINKLGEKRKNLQLENLLQLLRQGEAGSEHTIALPTSKETRFVKTGQIIRCESSNNYTSFYFTNGEKLLVSKPIFEYEELLADYGFIRCHQSHLVNRKYIKSWRKEDGGYLLLEDNTELPVSRQKKEMVLRMITKAN